MKKLIAKLMVLGALVAILTTGAVMADHSASYHAYKLVNVGNTSFRNWDFRTDTEGQSNVDWPVTMVFSNGANVALVEGFFQGIYTSGSSKYFSHYNNGTQQWDSSGGIKYGGYCTTFRHFRHYGNYYNTTWGNHVLATTHIDKWECTNWRWYGESEQSEEWFVDRAESLGLHVDIYEDSYYMENWEQYRQVGRHRVRNNGYATVFDLNNDYVE